MATTSNAFHALDGGANGFEPVRRKRKGKKGAHNARTWSLATSLLCACLIAGAQSLSHLQVAANRPHLRSISPLQQQSSQQSSRPSQRRRCLQQMASCLRARAAASPGRPSPGPRGRARPACRSRCSRTARLPARQRTGASSGRAGRSRCEPLCARSCSRGATNADAHLLTQLSQGTADSAGRASELQQVRSACCCSLLANAYLSQPPGCAGAAALACPGTVGGGLLLQPRSGASLCRAAGGSSWRQRSQWLSGSLCRLRGRAGSQPGRAARAGARASACQRGGGDEPPQAAGQPGDGLLCSALGVGAGQPGGLHHAAGQPHLGRAASQVRPLSIKQGQAAVGMDSDAGQSIARRSHTHGPSWLAADL